MLRQRFFREKWIEKIGEAEEIRHASDYDDFYIASKEETERQIAVIAGVSRKILYGTKYSDEIKISGEKLYFLVRYFYLDYIVQKSLTL